MPLKKIIWITNWPNNIYTSIFEALKKHNPKLNLTFVFTNQFEGYKNNYFKVCTLKSFMNLFKPLFFPYLLLNFLRKTPNSDLPFLVYMRGLNRMLTLNKPDVVVSNLFYMPSTWQAAWYCMRTKTPFILQTEIKRLPQGKLASIFVRIVMRVLTPVFRQASLILPWTSEGVLFGKKYFHVKNKSRIKLLPAAIDTSIFNSKKYTERKSDVLKILIAARLVPFKRHSDILNAIRYIKEKSNIKIHLDILGKGPLEDKIRKEIDSLGLSKEVDMLGHVNFSEMQNIYENEDLIVLPSYNEAIGMVIPEAMACGLPAIVSDTAGAKTYVEHGKNGYVFKTFDYIDLAKKIIMISKGNRVKLFGINARKTIILKYDLKVVSKRFYNALKWTYQRNNHG